MKSSVKGSSILLLLLLLLGGSAAKSQNGPGGQGKAQPKFDIPIPVGHDAKGIKLPYFDRTGKLKMDFSIEVGNKIDEDHLQMKNVHVNTYDDKGNLDVMVDLPACVLDLNTRVVTSKVPAAIERSDFEIIGETMRFDTAAKSGEMHGRVRMLIFNRQDVSPGESGT